jgi:protein involved in polysaccharide export with SLBB domain
MKKFKFFWLPRLLAICALFVALDGWTDENTRTDERAEGDHKIAPLDIINIDVVGEKDLSKENLRVSSSGTITFPFLGSVEVKGKTPAEVENLLKEKLGKDYLVNPQVIVTVKEYRSRTVSVIGQVNKPGNIALPAEQKMGILEAIAQAGDLAKSANKNRIEVSRKGKTQKFTLDDLKKDTSPEKKFWLEPGDVIYVHESFF